MMRVALILALVSAPVLAIAQEPPASEPTAPQECQSCTARHKSLQALQQALSAPDAEDEAPEDDIGEATGD